MMVFDTFTLAATVVTGLLIGAVVAVMNCCKNQ